MHGWQNANQPFFFVPTVGDDRDPQLGRFAEVAVGDDVEQDAAGVLRRQPVDLAQVLEADELVPVGAAAYCDAKRGLGSGLICPLSWA